MTKQYTEADIDKMLLPALRSLASQYFEAADLKGLKKADLVDLLKDNLATINGSEGEEPEVDEDDDELDDEVDDSDEEDDEDVIETLLDEEDDDEIDDSVLDEAEEEDEVDDEPVKPTKAKAPAKAKAETPPEPKGDTLTAKQVATRIGTDSKTLRKFFRSDKSTVEAVGQGGRYEFAKEDLAKIQAEFDAWNGTRTTRATKPAEPKAAPEPKRQAVEDELDDDEAEIDDEELEPGDDELDDDEVDDLELDDLELDD